MQIRLFLLVVLSAIAVACAPAADPSESDDALTSNQTRKFDPNRLLEDEDILGGADITAEQVQSFLDSKGSYLATYKDGDSTAAELIVDRCHEKGVNPIYMLARIQGESSLVSSKSEKNLSKATGCGCPDGKACSDEYKGFGNQVTCAANLISKYFTEMDTEGETVSGYAVDKPLRTLDPCSVTPKNRATVALYTYTPWVGSHGDGCGSSKYGG